MQFLSILTLIFSPLFAALLIMSPFFPNNEIKIRRFSKAFAGAHFIYSMLFLLFYNPTNFGWSYQKELTFFHTSWLKPLGITATFGVDGISLVFVLLTSFITLMAVIASKSMVRTKHRMYYSLVLILQTALLGVFCAKDIFLFFLFWELELIPMYFLISQWGDKNSRSAAMKYLLYTFFGSIFILLGMLVLYFYSFSISGVLTADIESLSMSENVFAMWFQSFIFFAFLFGFAVKLPIVPFHTWLPQAHTAAVTPVSMLLAGVLLKLGGYGIIRFNLGLFPEVFTHFAPLIIVLGVINIIYGACVALVQTDIKKVVAFSSISHMGLVLVGLGVLNEIGFKGAIFQMAAHGLIAAGLFMLVGVIYLRTKTREISALGGLSQVIPICMYLGLIICLAAAGVPLLAAFPAEFMTLVGLVSSDVEPQIFVIVMAFFVMLGMILSACYILYLFHKTFYGAVLSQFKADTVQVNDDGTETVIIYPKRGVTKSEVIVLSSLVFAIVLFGVFPNAILEIFRVSTDVILDFIKV